MASSNLLGLKRDDTTGALIVQTAADDAPAGQSGTAGRLWLPTGAKMSNIDRGTTPLTDVAWLTSGTLKVAPLGILRASDSLASLTFYAGSQAAVTPTNYWACLIRASDLKIKAISNDKLTTAWAAQGASTFTFGAAYSPTVDEKMLVGLMVAAATVPTIWGIATANAASNSPAYWGSSNTGLTTPLALDTVVTTPGGDSKFGYVYAS